MEQHKGAAPLTGRRFFRVQGDWTGGGFGYTFAFKDEQEAEAWGRQKARFHPDAVITVIDRGPADAELKLAAMFAGSGEFPVARRPS